MSTLIPLLVTGCVFSIIAVIFVAAAAVAAWRVYSTMNAAQAGADAVRAAHAQALQAPQPTPEQYGMALVGILTGSDDYGTWPPDPPRKMLAGSWSITDTAGARSTIENLLSTTDGGDALVFDRVRACHLSRAAAGALFLEQEESWGYVYKAARDLQMHFVSFDEVGQAYIRGKNAWLQARDIDTNDGTEAKVQALQNGLWQTLPFKMALPFL